MTAPHIHPMVPVLNTPTKPQVLGAATGRNQKDRRYFDTFYDQHRHPKFPQGRPWTGSREIAANHDLMHEDGFVTADLMMGVYVEGEDGNCDRAATLASTWQAPWRPLAKYFRFNYKRKTIFLDYPRMRKDEDDGLKRYYKAASELGIQLNVRVEPGVMPHPQIVYKLGAPSRMIRIAEAAMAGDPWLMGFIDEPNPDLADILGYHPTSGIPVSSYQGYTPPELEQTKTVDAILAAPPGADLLELIATMAAKAAASAVDNAFAKRDQDERDRKAEQSKKIKDGMAKAKASTTAGV